MRTSWVFFYEILAHLLDKKTRKKKIRRNIEMPLIKRVREREGRNNRFFFYR